MKGSVLWKTAVLIAILIGLAVSAEKRNYPEPRFPSYVRPPKSVDEIMPFARAAVRQTGGRTPLGRVTDGTTVLLVADTLAEQLVL